MAETRIVVEHREHLWWLLAEAAQLEQGIMCQYLYAAFSLKAGTDEGVTAEQLRQLVVEPMAPGEHHNWVAVMRREISGRRFRLGTT